MKKTEENKSLISIPLDIPDVRVLKTEVTSTGDFRITVESTLGSTMCRKCGRETTEFHCLAFRASGTFDSGQASVLRLRSPRCSLFAPVQLRFSG